MAYFVIGSVGYIDVLYTDLINFFMVLLEY